MTVRGLTLAYWRYRRAGAAGGGGGTPAVVVHGGPAFAHTYMLPLKQQACRGRELVFYDQVGAGASSQPANVSRDAPWLLTVDYYVEELRALVDALGWPRFHFIGNSWGTFIGQAYALAGDRRLEAVVLSGPLSDPKLYIDAQWDEDDGTLGSLPEHVQALLREVQRRRAFDSPIYAAADATLTSFFTCRTMPLPDCVVAATPTTATAHEIYVAMQGASEFDMAGVMAATNFTPVLHRIRNPVLLTHGRFDTMRPKVIDVMYRSLPNAWRAYLPRSGHMSMVDDPRLMNDVVGDFLAAADAGSLAAFRVPAAAAEPAEPEEGARARAASQGLAANAAVAEGAAVPTWLTTTAALAAGLAAGGVLGATWRSRGASDEACLASSAAPLLGGRA